MFANWRAAAIPGLVLAMGLGLGFGSPDADAAAADESSGKLLITGSSTMAPMMVEIGKRFQTLHPKVQIEVQMGGSGRGVSDALQGRADIGMASRALTDTETSALFSFAMARDGVCLIVHKDNPVRSLGNQQVADIFTGNLNNWSQVGGRNAPITVMAAQDGYSSTELFTHFFKLKYPDIKTPMVLGDNPTRIKAVLENPNGIAWISVGEAERKAMAGVAIKALPVEGVAATKKNIRSGDFPISRPLLLLTKDRPTGLVKEFINFSLSPQVTDIIEKNDFIPYVD